MAGSGKKLSGGGARTKRRSPAAQPGDGGFGRPPHPLRLLAGQVFFPRVSNGRRRAFEVARTKDGRVWGTRLDGAREQVSVSATRLLERGEDGQGRFYSFLGYRPRRYRTWAQAAAADGARTVLVVPEWHPARPVRVPAGMLPGDARAPGSWLEVSADLSAASAARLRLVALRACAPPPTELCCRPRYRSARGVEAGVTPELGAGCGDIVLETAPTLIRSGSRTVPVFVAERPEGVGAGSRAYLPDGATVIGWLTIVSAERSPSGCRLQCDSQLHRLSHPVPVEGAREAGMWRWRWWRRGAESDASKLGRYEYVPRAHRGGYVWRNRREGGS
jgi:hypothetical protein